jgi:hypothetical protein
MSTTLTIEAFRGGGGPAVGGGATRATGGQQARLEEWSRTRGGTRLGGGGLRKENDGREVVRFPYYTTGGTLRKERELQERVSTQWRLSRDVDFCRYKTDRPSTNPYRPIPCNAISAWLHFPMRVTRVHVDY